MQYTQLLFFLCTQEINFTVKIACPSRNSRNLENMDSSDDDNAPKQCSHSSYSMGLHKIPITFYGCGVLHTTTTRMIVTCLKVYSFVQRDTHYASRSSTHLSSSKVNNSRSPNQLEADCMNSNISGTILYPFQNSSTGKASCSVEPYFA